MTTLLEKAKAVPISKIRKKDITDEHLDVMLAWIDGEITNSQIMVSLGMPKTGGTCLYLMSQYIRWGVQNNKIKITKIE